MPAIQNALLLCFLGAVICLEGDLRKQHVLLRKLIEQSKEKDLQHIMQQAAMTILPTKSSAGLGTITVTATVTKPCTYPTLAMSDAMAGLLGCLLIWSALFCIALVIVLALPSNWPLRLWLVVQDFFSGCGSVVASVVHGVEQMTATAIDRITNNFGGSPDEISEVKKHFQPETEVSESVHLNVSPVPATEAPQTVIDMEASLIDSIAEIIPLEHPSVHAGASTTGLEVADAEPSVIGSAKSAAKDPIIAATNEDIGKGIKQPQPSESVSAVTDQKIAGSGSGPPAVGAASTSVKIVGEPIVASPEPSNKVVDNCEASSSDKTNTAVVKDDIKTEEKPSFGRQASPTIAAERRSGIAEKDVNYDESLRILHNAELALNDEFIKVMTAKLKHEAVARIDEDFVLHADCFQLTLPKVSRTHSKRLKLTLHLHAELLAEAMQGLDTIIARLEKPAMSLYDIPFELVKEVLNTSPKIARQEIADRVKELYKDTVVGVWLPKVAEIVNEEVAARDPPFQQRVSHIVW